MEIQFQHNFGDILKRSMHAAFKKILISSIVHRRDSFLSAPTVIVDDRIPFYVLLLGYFANIW